MKHSSQAFSLSGKLVLAAGAGLSIALALCVVGCSNTTTNGTSSSSSGSTAAQQTNPVYMGTVVDGMTNPDSTYKPFISPLAYSVNDKQGVFQVIDYDTLGSSSNTNVVSQTIFSGNVTAGQRGLHALDTTVSYSVQQVPNGYEWLPSSYPAPGLIGGFAVELAGQAGGFVQVAGQPVAPVVNASQCPSSDTHTYQFITIPGIIPPPSNNPAGSWNPASDTAYGSVDVSSSGSTVTYKNISQFIFPKSSTSGGSAPPAQPATSPTTGMCGPTQFGNVTNVPGQLVITDPNPGGIAAGEQIPPQAMIGIDASGGLLVEDNGSGASGPLPGTNPPLRYHNILGAGTGAVGLAKPSSALDTGAMVGAQYMGFIYGAGVYTQPDSTYPMGIKNLSSHLASFGFPSSSSTASCPTPGNSSNPIYGGDFTNDDPSTSSSGYGNCDVTIALGPEDSKNAGLYTQATVSLGASYAANTTGNTYSFPAVAIAGQINGKYAIFLLGLDNIQGQPWAIYLLQSN